jgi:hypothetical protein
MGGEARLAEVLASLSLATDLGTAFPLEKALRNALLATGIGRRMGLTRQALSDVYYLAMLRFLGCSAFAHELAAAFGGDDNAFHSTYEPVDFSRPQEIFSTTLTQLALQAGPFERVTAILRFLTSGQKIATRMQAADCEPADRLATRLGLSDGVRQGLAHVWTRWDGHSNPATPETAASVLHAAEALERVGAGVEEGRPAGVERSFELATRLFAADGGAGVGMLLQMAGTTTPSPLLTQLGLARGRRVGACSADRGCYWRLAAPESGGLKRFKGERPTRGEVASAFQARATARGVAGARLYFAVARGEVRCRE